MKNLLTISQELTVLGDKFLSKEAPGSFPQEAKNLLETSSIADAFDYQELVESVLKESFRPAQNYGAFQFSDLPITLARGKSCFVDLYFWRRRPTVIHNHHFTGAFICLDGFNVDLEYEFTESRRLGAYHSLGTLAEVEARQMRKGDAKAISYLDGFIHQNHHQSDLTANICFRTPEFGEADLSNYLYSGLRFEKNQVLLDRFERLMGLIRLGEFRVTKADLTVDDALYFLIQNHRSTSESRQFLKVRDLFRETVQRELGVDLPKLLEEHDLRYEAIQAHYE